MIFVFSSTMAAEHHRRLKPVILVGGETVSLPYFNFEDMFLSLVHDEKLRPVLIVYKYQLQIATPS